jgi:hypothetical protein
MTGNKKMMNKQTFNRIEQRYRPLKKDGTGIVPDALNIG